MFEKQRREFAERIRATKGKPKQDYHEAMPTGDEYGSGQVINGVHVLYGRRDRREIESMARKGGFVAIMSLFFLEMALSYDEFDTQALKLITVTVAGVMGSIYGFLSRLVSRLVVDARRGLVSVRGHSLAGSYGRARIYPLASIQYIKVSKNFIRITFGNQFLPWVIPRFRKVVQSKEFAQMRMYGNFGPDKEVCERALILPGDFREHVPWYTWLKRRYLFPLFKSKKGNDSTISSTSLGASQPPAGFLSKNLGDEATAASYNTVAYGAGKGSADVVQRSDFVLTTEKLINLASRETGGPKYAPWLQVLEPEYVLNAQNARPTDGTFLLNQAEELNKLTPGLEDRIKNKAKSLGRPANYNVITPNKVAAAVALTPAGYQDLKGPSGLVRMSATGLPLSYVEESKMVHILVAGFRLGNG